MSYYFYKLLVGVELTSLSAIVLGALGQRPCATTRSVLRPSASRARRATQVAAVLATTLAATQVTGLTLTARHTFATAAISAPVPAAIIAAASRPATAARSTLLVSASPGDTLEAQQWYLALAGRWTEEANEAATIVLLQHNDEATTAGLLLNNAPDALVLVEPATLESVRRSVGTTGRADRVLGW